MNPTLKDDPRVALAAERTLLAWIRTGIAMMGLGFVMARFGLFLHELAAMNPANTTPKSSGVSMWVGSALLIAGALMMVLATLQHQKFLTNLERGAIPLPAKFSLSVIIALGSAIVGLGMAGYLFFMK